jgi:hypothetical protein
MSDIWMLVAAMHAVLVVLGVGLSAHQLKLLRQPRRRD